MHPVTSGEPPAEPVRTLYHGTLKSLVPAILRDGLWPGVGVFTRSMYAELEEAGGELPDLVFASDRHGVRACYSAILDGIRRCGVRRPDATDFAEMGAILIIRKAAGRFVQRPPDDDGGWHDHPETSEPGDFYTDSEVPVDGVISGRRVLRFLHRHGVDLSHLSAGSGGSGFAAGMQELVGVAHAHLRNALEFTLLIPAREVGIRRFCLWAIGLAVLTVKRIAANPGFTQGSQVKVSRRTVTVTLALCNAATRHNRMLRFLFDRAAAGLPRAVLAPDWAPRKLPTPGADVAGQAANAYHRTRRVSVRDAAQDQVALLRQPDRGTAQ